jgi:type III pantothenate kinase
MKSVLSDSSWLALMIGNSRLHWALFSEEKLCLAWDSQYLPASVVQQLAKCQTLNDFPVELLPPQLIRDINSEEHSSRLSPLTSRLVVLSLASVVPNQTALWQGYSNVLEITLDQVPLQGVYPTLGIDRALALWGAGETWGWPMLVIDAGTALTLTGADANRCLIGGAILPGLGLQFQSLSQKTANLPLIDTKDVAIPPRWAINTQDAISSGIIYTIIAGIRDFIEAWWQEFPDSYISLTGGDRTLLLTYLQAQFPDIAAKVIPDPNLIFWGMRSCRRRDQGSGVGG